MLFNSAIFALFIVIVYSLYLLLQKNLRLQNRMLLAASCVFYGWWDWRFLFLMFFTIAVDFFVARALHATSEPGKRKFLLGLSVGSNLSILGFFKYFNFFRESFEPLFQALGFSVQGPMLNIILPVGISFYTFQSMSYVVDVYRRQLNPAEHLLDYAAYVSYFPQLVAGPIERGSHLLPQILRPRVLKRDQFYEGGYLIAWGLYKKTFIADNLAKLVDPVFASPAPYNGAIILVALYAFAFQIYCDFSAYSDIARGLGKCMGFDIMVNFKLPYFSTNPAEFWKRWHISLSTWLRDYLYIPLGGNRKGRWIAYRNLALTMLLGGLWHGASWTFVIWGAYHGLLLIVHRILKPALEILPRSDRPLVRNLVWGAQVIYFFHLVCLGWLFFRAESLSQAITMMQALFTQFHFVAGAELKMAFLSLTGYIFLLLIVQCFQYVKNNLLVVLKMPVWLRILFYVVCFYSVKLMGAMDAREFIYFQF